MFSQILSIAKKEFSDRIRNKWVLAVTLIFLIFSFVISYFGSAYRGDIGISSIESIISSLVSLVIYLLPLIALILGYDAIVGEREKGTFELLISMPISKRDLLFGKYLGLALALIVPTIIGFGVMGIVLIFKFPLNQLLDYIGFILSAILMGLAFLSLALLISVFSSDRAQAGGIAIALWFFFILIFDLLLLGILVAGKGAIGGSYFPYLLLLNPVDIFRILNIFSTADIQNMYGLMSIFPNNMSHPLFLGIIMCVWIIIPLMIAKWKLINE